MDCLFHRFSALIHKGHRFGKDDLFGIDPSGSVKDFEASGLNGNTADFGKAIDCPKSNVVPGVLIVDTGIPQPHNDLHPLLFFLLCLRGLCLFGHLSNHCLRGFLLSHGSHHSGDRKVRVEQDLRLFYLNILDMNRITDF